MTDNVKSATPRILLTYIVISSEDEPAAPDMMTTVVIMYQVGVKWGIWWKEVDEVDDVRPSGNQSGTVVDWLGLMEQ